MRGLRPGSTGPPAAALAAALALLLGAAPARADLAVPALTGPVVDQAGLLGRDEVARIEALCRAARARDGGQGVQLQYLVVRSLLTEPIESFSMRVAEAWKLGSKGSDNGVLVTVAVEDREVRIEVGGGLEGGLTDLQSARIIRETMAPAFRQGHYGDGLYAAGVQILGALGALPQNVAAPRPARPAVHLSSIGVVGLVVLFILLRMVMGFGLRRRWLWGLPWIVGSGWGGGSRWGGGGLGGGGGSWSGGGGGFSGGGASGGW
ncbi:MAG TPA: TPM domain-containing protein [Anaeromyxobacter sp.]|nr:TPM domain-containing protein [Anaeromyxobacter sp.]